MLNPDWLDKINDGGTARFRRYRGLIIAACAARALILAAIAWVAVANPAAAAPVKEIQEAQRAIESGDAAAALEQLQELQVDYPESPEVRFALACAWYFKGDQALEQGAAEEAATAYAESRKAFDALRQELAPAIAREATFNRANCMLREARMIDAQKDYAGAAAALRGVVEAFEQGLNLYPDHKGIRQNLDHARFALKQLLQQPPEEQEQQQQDQSDDQQPKILSRFSTANTEVPNAKVQYEDNTAILVLPKQQEGTP